MIPEDLKYSEDHEWVRLEGDTATVGITHHAQEELTDIVFVELPEVGRQVSRGDAVGVLESVKSVSDLYSPVDGEIVAVNEALGDAPEKINEAPYGDGWIFKIKISSGGADDLMDATAYAAHIGG